MAAVVVYKCLLAVSTSCVTARQEAGNLKKNTRINDMVRKARVSFAKPRSSITLKPVKFPFAILAHRAYLGRACSSLLHVRGMIDMNTTVNGKQNTGSTIMR